MLKGTSLRQEANARERNNQIRGRGHDMDGCQGRVKHRKAAARFRTLDFG